MLTKHRLSRLRQAPVVILDVGTSKICCWSARLSPEGHFEISGVGHQATRGYTGGYVRDMTALEATLSQAVHDVERTSGERIQEVIVGISTPYLKSALQTVSVSLLGRAVTEEDIRRLFIEARLQVAPELYHILHALPVQYALDDQRGIDDPLGMLGQNLRGAFHLLAAPLAPLRNLSLAIEQCHLQVGAFVSSIYGAGLACLTPDERLLGATLIDLGAGTTTVGVFWGGQMVHTEAIPLGGKNITTDLAHGLETSLAQAERLKVLYGAALSSGLDGKETVMVATLGEEDHHAMHPVPREALVDIIQPRIEEIFVHVKEKLDKESLAPFLTQRFVLTGGGSQLSGIQEVAQRILGRSIRLARPQSVAGATTDRPEFATTVGLLLYTQTEEFQRMSGFLKHHRRRWPALRQITSWLRENL